MMNFSPEFWLLALVQIVALFAFSNRLTARFVKLETTLEFVLKHWNGEVRSTNGYSREDCENYKRRRTDNA